MGLDEELALIQSQLTTEEQRGSSEGLSDLARRLEEREVIKGQLSHLAGELGTLTRRFERLPALPSLTQVRRAQSVLAYPNGRILSVDTASSLEEAQIIRVLLLDFDGAVRFDKYVAAGCTPSRQEMQTLGITAQNLREAPSLPQIWSTLLDALMGCYIVSYDLGRVRQVLEKSAELYGLYPPTIIGDSWLKQCLSYFQAAGFVGLESLCNLVGCPLPGPPDCTAVDRARGQLCLLQAMAKGLTGGSRADSMLRGRDVDISDDHKERRAQIDRAIDDD